MSTVIGTWQLRRFCFLAIAGQFWRSGVLGGACGTRLLVFLFLTVKVDLRELRFDQMSGRQWLLRSTCAVVARPPVLDLS